MRWRLIGTAIILSAGGCTSGDPPPPRLASKPCAKVAEIRMSDARVNGYDEKAQNTVFQYSYDDCVKWEARGYEPAIP